jgi:hypothetical protein
MASSHTGSNTPATSVTSTPAPSVTISTPGAPMKGKLSRAPIRDQYDNDADSIRRQLLFNVDNSK